MSLWAAHLVLLLFCLFIWHRWLLVHCIEIRGFTGILSHCHSWRSCQLSVWWSWWFYPSGSMLGRVPLKVFLLHFLSFDLCISHFQVNLGHKIQHFVHIYDTGMLLLQLCVKIILTISCSLFEVLWAHSVNHWIYTFSAARSKNEHHLLNNQHDNLTMHWLKSDLKLIL